MKCIFQTFPDPKSGAYGKVYHNTRDNEYVAKFYNSRHVHMNAADYYTDDRRDVFGTLFAEMDFMSIPFADD